MGEASKEAELQQQAVEKEAAFTARKKARLQKPNAASDKGRLKSEVNYHQKVPTCFSRMNEQVKCNSTSMSRTYHHMPL